MIRRLPGDRAVVGEWHIGLVLALGDTQYECGELENYLGAYDLSWGQFKGMTRPAPGHHEYLTSSPKGCLGRALVL